MLPLGRHKVLGRVKQGEGLDSAHGPCVCHLCLRLSKGMRGRMIFLRRCAGLVRPTDWYQLLGPSAGGSAHIAWPPCAFMPRKGE